MNNKYSFLPFILLLTGCAFLNSNSTVLNYAANLNVVTRSEWGWKPLEKTVPEHKIEYITLHHGGVLFDEDKDPVEYIKNLQDWSRAEKHWIDIPYHYMIDLKGVIYEARPIKYPGDTNTDYDPAGHVLICLMGNYEEQTVTDIQLKSIIDLSAFLAKEYSVPLNRIKSHKDYTETACPGVDLYRYLEDGTIINGIKAHLK